MPCDTVQRTPARDQIIREALRRLDAALEAGTVQAVIGATGGIAFRGWKDADGVSDLCAYRALGAQNSPALRRAIARAEVTSGRKLDPRALAHGTHSHDGGHSWGQH